MNELEDTVTPEDHEKIKEIKEFIRTSLSDS